MSDIKHVMLPRIEEKPKTIKPQPWYKERLRTKYLTKNPNKEKLLDAKQWVFIKDGLDDFRDGLPPPHDDVMIKPNKGPKPGIKNEKWEFKKATISPLARLNSYQSHYSKKLPLVEAREENINKIIEGLSQHPLALYGHIENALPPDLFEEVLDVLDPEINQQLESNLNDSFEKPTTPIKEPRTNEIRHSERKIIREEVQKLEESLKEQQEIKRSEKEKRNVRNTYKWLLKKEEIKARAKGPDPEQIKAQAIDNHIKNVTLEYCDWVKSLGGEHNIDPLTLTSLFASGYDTKPPLSVPINVVDLSNIPPELRSVAYVPPDPDDQQSNQVNIYRDDKDKSSHSVNYRYGAWYLPKELWKRMGVNEKLADPRLQKDADKDDSIKRAREINAKLAPLHGTNAFKEFSSSKKLQRVPKLLEELSEWENEQKLMNLKIDKESKYRKTHKGEI